MENANKNLYETFCKEYGLDPSNPHSKNDDCLNTIKFESALILHMCGPRIEYLKKLRLIQQEGL